MSPSHQLQEHALELLPAALQPDHVPPRLDQRAARLRAAGVALCLADWPECPVTGPLTAPFVYLRRHGPAGRYAGSYADAALEEDARRLRAWRRAGLDAYVYFNNDQAANAARDAARLAARLSRRP